MSHEIRTPLNAIIGVIRELAKSEFYDEDREFINIAQKASSHLLSIVNNVLDISKIEARELNLEQSHFSFIEVLDDVENILSNQVSRDISFSLKTENLGSGIYIGDLVRIRQVLLNLATNAIKFTERGFVRIHCSASPAGEGRDKLTIMIEDSGIGMDEKFTRKIFKKFQQEDLTS